MNRYAFALLTAMFGFVWYAEATPPNYGYFNQPEFVIAPLASPRANPADVFDKPFVGQGGWSNSVETSGGHINAYATDGLYAGEQALDTNGNPFERYTGAHDRDNTPELISTEFNQPQWEVEKGFAVYVGDLVSNQERNASLGFWTDQDEDGLFDVGENSFHSGVFSEELFPGFKVSSFGIQTALGTTLYADGLGGVTTDISTAVPVTDLGWYRVVTNVVQNVNGVDYDLSMSVQHLSAGPNQGLFIDFDTSMPGSNPIAVTLTSAELGMDIWDNGAPIEGSCRTAEGIPPGLFADVGGIMALDLEPGIAWRCNCVPEANSMTMLGTVGVVGLLIAGYRARTRRARKCDLAA